MAAETSFYTWLLESLPGADYSRTKLRDIVNDVQNEALAARDGRLMQIKPEPYLEVLSSSVHRYVANDSVISALTGGYEYDIRRIGRIYALTTQDSSYGSYGGYGSGSRQGLPYQRNAAAVPEVDMPVESQDSSKPMADDCIVDFDPYFDPAVSDSLYRVVAWAWPTQLTSENVAIKLPLQFRKTVLLFGVLSKLETRDFGRDDTIREKYEKALADWYRYDEAGQASFKQLRTPPREC